MLKGLGDGLGEFMFCKCEVTCLPFYEGGAGFKAVDAQFRTQGVRLASHFYARVPRHGDVLYARQA